jgi:NAD(P)-dependent dehydrogenase (short-subunit alcohol dehydrogenase family)
MFDLSGKNAIVTGASRGIGLAIARGLAASGARVAISSRSQADCDAVAAELCADHGADAAIAVAADLADRRSLEVLVERTRADLGPIDILIANAAVNPHFGPLSQITDDDFRTLFEQNILANLWLAQMARVDMAARGGGSIVMISSIGGLRGTAATGGYNVSKAADLQMVRNLAVEFGSDNIRVNAIAPGTVKTELARPLWANPDEERKRARATALGRLAEPHEIAGAAVFLASGAASFVTGHTLVVDGGRTINASL